MKPADSISARKTSRPAGVGGQPAAGTSPATGGQAPDVNKGTEEQFQVAIPLGVRPEIPIVRVGDACHEYRQPACGK